MDNYTREGRWGIRMQAPISSKTVMSELTGDFSLPDYQPQIKRLLQVRATATPAERYVGVGNAEMTGTVNYSILYAGNDGALYSVSQSEEYRFAVPVELTSEFEIGDGIVCDVETAVETASGRVVSPRKLSLRAKLRSCVRLLGTRIVEEKLDAAPASSLQRLCKTVPCAQSFCGVGEPMTLQDEMLLDAQWSDVRVISADGQVLVTEAIAGSNAISCRGEVYLRLLCCHEAGDASPTAMMRKIPFSQSVAADGCEVNCEAVAHGVCSDLAVTVEDGRILCDVSVRLQARAERNVDVTFTKDLYSTAAEGENRYVEIPIPILLRAVNANFSVNHALSPEEAGIRNGVRILDATLLPGAVTVESANGKYRLLGRCRCQLILSDGDDMSAQEIEVPYRFEVDGSDARVEDFSASVDALACRARIDGDRIFVDGELAVCATLRGEGRLRMLAEAKLGDPTARSSSAYTVCYPSSGDSLWSVSKRYHRSVEEVSLANDLSGAASADSPESLAGVVYLLV